MLRLLHIENIAVIEQADILFERGFNVMTGETGAGKSIVIDAISAILGERAYRDMIRTGAARAAVRAIFDDVPELAWFAENSVPYDTEVVVQREIYLDGKNLCRVNGVAVTVGILRRLGLQLINIHGQHDSQQLFDEENHLIYLDAFARDEKELEDYRAAFDALQAVRREMQKLSMDESENRVVLMTLHSAKGLEFPYVYLSGMEDGLFPSSMSILSDDADAVEEERRLCYVGITRARERLTMTAARQRMTNGETRFSKLSRFVEEIPPMLLDRQNQKSMFARGGSWAEGQESGKRSGNSLGEGLHFADDFDDSGLPWGDDFEMESEERGAFGRGSSRREDSSSWAGNSSWGGSSFGGGSFGGGGSSFGGASVSGRGGQTVGGLLAASLE